MGQQSIEGLAKHLIEHHNLNLDDEQLEAIQSNILDGLIQAENVGYFTKRLEHNPKETAFHDQWIKENRPLSWVNSGHGLLQDLFFERQENQKWKCIVEINKRDREIVATVIQWLGTNMGICFLETTLRSVGYKIVKI
jgi:hypothetical protein